MSSLMTVSYPAIFTPEENGGYFIEFLDVPGAYTGINQNDITAGLSNAEEVLGMVLSDMIERGEEIPEPTDLQKFRQMTINLLS